MPTYLYECKACERQFEVEQRITEEPLKDCGCGSKGALRRLIQPTAILFKGGGFHVNDYAPEASAAPKGECSGEPKSCPACSDAAD